MVFITTDIKYIGSKDYWACKVLGSIPDEMCFVNDGKIEMKNKMFIGIGRILNVVCYDMLESNYYEKGKKRFCLLKHAYNFAPGSNVEIVSDFQS